MTPRQVIVVVLLVVLGVGVTSGCSAWESILHKRVVATVTIGSDDDPGDSPAVSAQADTVYLYRCPGDPSIQIGCEEEVAAGGDALPPGARDVLANDCVKCRCEKPVLIMIVRARKAQR